MTPVNPVLVHARVLDQLHKIPSLSVYDGVVPARVPEYPYGGGIKPYVALWMGSGTDIWDDRDLATGMDYTGTRMVFQTTCAASTVPLLLEAAHSVKLYLSGLRVGSGEVMPVDEQQSAAYPLPDDAVTPARVFLPLQWQLATTNLGDLT